MPCLSNESTSPTLIEKKYFFLMYLLNLYKKIKGILFHDISDYLILPYAFNLNSKWFYL